MHMARGKQLWAVALLCGSAGDGLHTPPPPRQSDSRLIMHVCLEYSVPHLGMNSELMFGGLGKVGGGVHEGVGACIR